MMTLIQLPHFLRFSVRMLCLQVFFISVFISSQTPFSYSDSTIFVSDDSYLYVESPVDVSTTTFVLGKKKPIKQLSIIRRKAFLRLNSSFISKNQNNPSNQLSFSIPKSSHYVGSTNNTLSTAVLGNPFPTKLNYKMTGSAFWILPQVIVSEDKLLYNIINHFNILKITTNHFSRPPPILAGISEIIYQ